MPLITTTITPFTKTPSRQNPSTFSADMDDRLSEENSRITQMNSQSSEMNDVADLINTQSTSINTVSTNIASVNTVATDIAKVNTVSTNIAKVSNLDTNMTKIANLDTNMTKIANVDNNMTKVQNLDTNMTAITTVNTNIASVNTVSTNIANVIICATNIGTIASKVSMTGDETIAGVKTFSSSPIVPTPTTDMEVSTKKYVDDLVGSHIELSGATSYHLLQGNMSLSNTISTNGFSTTLYTGNGSTQSINTGVDMDTQWGNDASEKFGGLVWWKSRSLAYNHRLSDSISGATKDIETSTTSAQYVVADGLTSFTSSGFTIGANAGRNQSAVTYASWNFQTTHRTSGTTNHGKAYTCHYNPFTGFTIVKYEGSGIAGHEIPHHLGRKLGFVTEKSLSETGNWGAFNTITNNILYLNLTDVQSAPIAQTLQSVNDTSVIVGNGGYTLSNKSGMQFVVYGWANSYIDESNKLIGNYEVGVYQGTGASGNKVVTRGKPAWVMIKRLDSTGNWNINDNKRQELSGVLDGQLSANSSAAEQTGYDEETFLSDGFTLNSGSSDNVSGGQYLYMVVYDNDSASGKSKYPRATDTTQIQLNNAIVPLPNGIDTNGVKVSTVSKNETVTGVTLTQGKNYLRWEN